MRDQTVIDKLELRIPHHESGPPFTPDFSRVFQELRNDPKGPFQRSRYYELFANLQPYGYDAALHLWSKRGRIPTHKLELLDTGTKSLWRMLHEVEQIFILDAFRCEVTRVDCAADVSNVPVGWFKQAMSVKWKRWHSEMSTSDSTVVEIGRTRPETIYFGKRPNITRVYDKNSEYEAQYARILKRCSPDQEPPTFEEIFGMPADPMRILTRVERVMAAGRVPEPLCTVADLRANAVEFDPFEHMQFLPTPVPVSVPGVSYAMECMIEKTQRLIREEGMHFTKRYVYSRSHGQGVRLWRRLEPYLLCDEAAESNFSKEALVSIYRKSVARQMAA
jgi:hypothetical protein